MQRLEVRGAVRPIYRSLGFKGLMTTEHLTFPPALYAYFLCIIFIFMLAVSFELNVLL